MGLLHLHNLLRWAILILLLFTIIKNYIDVNKPFSGTHRKLGLFTMIAAHIELLIGLYQVFFGRFSWMHKPEGVSVMKDTFWRYFLVEHPAGMIIAIVLITMGNSVSKKVLPDAKKHKKAALLFLLALLIIMVIMPWPFRGDAIARPLLPGM